MSDALSPIRHVYGVEPARAAPSGVEATLLEGMRDLLDARPALAPAASALAAVQARAAEASGLEDAPLTADSPVEAAVLDQSLAALDRLARPRPDAQAVAAAEAFAALAPALTAPQSPSAEAVAAVGAFAALAPALTAPQSPSAAAVAAVLARAAEPVGAPLATDSPVEAAVVAQSLAALDRLPRPRPDAATVAAVEAFAALQTDADPLAAVRHVYADGPAVASIEAVVLGQSRAVVERALASRPQPRPSAEAVALVLARAAEPAGDAFEAVPAEAALVAQSLAALDRLPRPRPAAAALDAVRLAAATATADAAPAPAPVVTPTPDRVPAAFLTGRFGAWAGAAALVLTAIVAVVVLPQNGPGAADAPLTVAAAAETAEADDVLTAEEASDEAAPERATPAPTAPLAAGGAASGFLAVAERAASRPTPPPTRQASTPPPADRPTPRASTPPAPPPSASAPAPAPVPSWDSTDDVRALSLRLQEIETNENLAWDAGPAEAFGVPSGPAAGSDPSVRAVRAVVPARARLRPDTDR